MNNLSLFKGEQCSSVYVWMRKTNLKGTQNSRGIKKEHLNHTVNQTVFSHVRALERTVISQVPPSSIKEPRSPAAPNRSRGLTHWVRRRPRRMGRFRGPFIFSVARQTRAEQLPGRPTPRGPQAWGGSPEHLPEGRRAFVTNRGLRHNFQHHGFHGTSRSRSRR